MLEVLHEAGLADDGLDGAFEDQIQVTQALPGLSRWQPGGRLADFGVMADGLGVGLVVLGALDPVIEIILVLVQVTDASRSINRLSTSVASKPPGDTV